MHALDIYNKVPLVNEFQPEISFNMTVTKSGPYVILINYVTPLDDLRTHKLDVEVHGKSRSGNGSVIMYSCPYNPTCRQVVIDEDGGVLVFDVEENSVVVNLKVSFLTEKKAVFIKFIYLSQTNVVVTVWLLAKLSRHSCGGALEYFPVH